MDDEQGSSNDFALLFCVVLITFIDAAIVTLAFLAGEYLIFVLSMIVMLICVLGLTSLESK